MPTIYRVVQDLLSRPVIRVAAISAFAGVGFSGANLVLAWALPEEDYGLVALVVALVNMGAGIGPLGLDGVVNRQLVRADRRLLNVGVAAGGICATAVCMAGFVLYDLTPAISMVMWLAIVAGALTMLAEARFQAVHRFVLATSLGQSGNLGLAAASLVVILLNVRSPVLAVSLIAGIFVATAAWSWSRLLSQIDYESRQIAYKDLSDAVSFAGIMAAAQLLLQIERMLIPGLISLEALATFGVMAAIVVAPYRTLQMAVRFTLLPRLRSTSDPSLRLQMLGKETAFLGVICALGALALWVLTPPVVELLYSEKFEVSQALLAAGIVSGIIKVLSAVVRTAAEAYCSTRELWIQTWLSWLAVGLSVAGAIVGVRWGLPGVVYGASAGPVIRSIPTALIAAKYYKA